MTQMHIQDIDLSQLPPSVKQTGWLDVAPRPDGSTWRLPFAGYFKPEVALLDNVQKGQQLGTVRDLFGEPLAELHANTDGVIIMLRRLHCVRVGDGLAHITKPHPG